MSKVQKISIALTHDMAQTVKSAVKQGEYGSASEAVRDALRDWSEKRAKKQAELKYLKKLWKEGIESGPGKFNSIEEIIAEADRQLKEKTNTIN